MLLISSCAEPLISSAMVLRGNEDFQKWLIGRRDESIYLWDWVKYCGDRLVPKIHSGWKARLPFLLCLLQAHLLAFSFPWWVGAVCGSHQQLHISWCHGPRSPSLQDAKPCSSKGSPSRIFFYNNTNALRQLPKPQSEYHMFWTSEVIYFVNNYYSICYVAIMGLNV